ncbi:type II toxin-antitoxin system VapB family antitoxin [Zhihengliuella sp. ISTPL4]|uniref:type II toxin-antitoxin system VapB family antitoxin n=1 Tax=Zhihengliuella sp. ISTPL4 TaxID=2058657 RepID=UPI0013051D8F|nr:type II toxin-antitoxin system VapB family antitoxin [Zhihengliuella sp. ISTPL4]
MATTSVDIDEDTLKQAKKVAGTTSDRETVDLALRALIAMRRQPELENALSRLRSVVDPATARAAQATENVWREIADEFGLLKSGEVGALLGASKSNREFVSIRRNRGELLGVVRNNGYLYPGFQFDRSTGTIKAWVKPLLELAREHSMGAVDVLFWMMTPTIYFGGDRPADHAGEGDRLLDVAGRSWSVHW